MRHTIPFDTHAYVKRLTSVGVPEAQAEVHAEAIAGLVNDELATKRDLEDLHIATKRDLEELHIATKRDLEELRIAPQRDLEELRIATQRGLEELRIATQRDLEKMGLQLGAELRETELRLKHDLTLRLGALMAAGVAIVAVLVKLL
jgi:hypothetical protein